MRIGSTRKASELVANNRGVTLGSGARSASTIAHGDEPTLGGGRTRHKETMKIDAEIGVARYGGDDPQDRPPHDNLIRRTSVEASVPAAFAVRDTNPLNPRPLPSWVPATDRSAFNEVPRVIATSHRPYNSNVNHKGRRLRAANCGSKDARNT
jgi:hypothetical protein